MNKEKQVILLINLAHKNQGLFSDSIETAKGAVCLSFTFDNDTCQKKFNEHVHKNSLCKCMQIGQGSNVSKLTI